MIGEGEIPQVMRPTFFSLRDAVYGAAVGDALGVPYEFCGRNSFKCTGMVSGGTHEQAAGTFKSGGYVLDTLSAAIWCFANTNSYEACVLAAVNLGEDTDTTACVAGALAGAVYGYEAIPSEWLDTLRGKDVIEKCLFPGFEKVRSPRCFSAEVRNLKM